jgi:hypothetical protein
MKICILAFPRTSSSSLLKVLGELTNTSIIPEPFNPMLWNYKQQSLNFNKIINSKDIIVKVMYDVNELPVGINSFEELLEIIKEKFTNIICLYRDNLREQSESFVYHRWLQDNVDKTIKWHDQKIYDISVLNETDIVNRMEFTKLQNKKLIDFANNNNFPIYRYEDLIINEGNNESFVKICEYIDIEFDYSKIYKHYNKNNRVRVERNIKSLI